MPTYDYLCRECENRFEFLLRSRSSKVACPKCSSRKVKKQVSSFRLNLGAIEETLPFSTCSCGKEG